MELKITRIAKEKTIKEGCLIPINVTYDGCCCTLNTRYEAIGINDIMTLAHFPRTVILIKYEV